MDTTDERHAMDSTGYSVATLGRFVGKEIGLSDWLTIDQDRIDRFADCTDDRQWIHVDPARARRQSASGTTIAHGYLTLSLVSRFIYEVGAVPPDATTALNYGLDRVRFLAPVKSGARIRDRVALLEATGKGHGRVLIKTGHTIEVEGEEKPALLAEALAMLFYAPGTEP
jgi:acyl dehydratase